MASTITKKLTKATGTVVTASFQNGIAADSSRQGIAPLAGPVTNLGKVEEVASVTDGKSIAPTVTFVD